MQPLELTSQQLCTIFHKLYNHQWTNREVRIDVPPSEKQKVELDEFYRQYPFGMVAPGCITFRQDDDGIWMLTTPITVDDSR